MAIEELGQAMPAVLGAVTGGGGVLAIAKLMLTRMVSQYDKKIEDLENKIERANENQDAADRGVADLVMKLTEKLHDSELEIAVITALFSDTKNLRIELQALVSRIQGELESKTLAVWDQVDSLLIDLYVAHERIRLISKGDTDIDKVQRPEKVRRR